MSTTKHQNKAWKSSSATNKDTRTTSRRCSADFTTNTKRSTHNPSAPFFDSEQTNAENIDTAWRFRDIPKVDREETAALHEGHGYSFLIVNFGKPSSNQWHEPDHPRQYIQKWHAQSRVRRLQWSVANAVLQSCLKSRLGTSPCMTPNAIQIKNCR